MSNDSRPELTTQIQRSSQVTTGVLLIVLGLLFFADRQEWQWGWHLSFYRLWPLLLIIFGISKLIVPIDEMIADQAGAPATLTVRRYRLGSGFWLVAWGVMLLLHVNNVLRFDQSWPLFIVLAGIGIIFGERRSRRRRER